MREHGGFHADEPLLGGAHDDGVVAAPAVRVGVLVSSGAEEGVFFFKELDDDGVRFEDGEVFVGLGLVASAVSAGVALTAGVVDVLDLWEVVALAGVEVVDAMGGRGVDGSGALVGGDVAGGDAEDAAVEEWVLEDCAFECAAGEAGDDAPLWLVRRRLCRSSVAVGDDGREQGFGDDIGCFRGLERDIFEVWIEGDGLRCGKGPGRRCPDDGVDLALPESLVWMVSGSPTSL